ncbi:hypothetical protein [Brevibacillus fulvus]|uniref:Uncharacterized protein n=1 Tax=Brevibacillus fulvus TaxID=1125967 RepID=A0A939BQL7_9BACL|nr:hypothetical protein [Brevibacillus fulvus]MBM7591765.1 hypothetical protein [Brevibacillus fulvus]
MVGYFKSGLIETHSKQEQLQKRLEAIEAELDGQNKKPVDPDSLHNLLSLIKDALLKADADEQKALLRLVVESIRITKDAPKRVDRQISQINLLFDFTIETLQKDSSILLTRLAAIQECDFISPLEPYVLDNLNSIDTDSLRDLMKSLNILPLFVVRFTEF